MRVARTRALILVVFVISTCEAETRPDPANVRAEHVLPPSPLSSTPAPIEECALCYDWEEKCPLPCTYGGCIFNKTYGTNALTRSGSCSGRTESLYLNRRGIASLPAGVFDDIAPRRVPYCRVAWAPNANYLAITLRIFVLTCCRRA